MSAHPHTITAKPTHARRAATLSVALLLTALLAGCSAGNTGCDDLLRQSEDEQRTTVRRALDQREMWSPTLDGATRELVFLCQFDTGATIDEVLDRSGVPDESSLFRGVSLALILIALGTAGTIAAKVMDNQRPDTPSAAGDDAGPSLAPASDPPSPTGAELERDPRLAQALEHGTVHYRVMWLITRRPQLTRPALIAASTDLNAEVTQALDDLALDGLIRMLPDGTLRAGEAPPRR